MEPRDVLLRGLVTEGVPRLRVVEVLHVGVRLLPGRSEPRVEQAPGAPVQARHPEPVRRLCWSQPGDAPFEGVIQRLRQELEQRLSAVVSACTASFSLVFAIILRCKSGLWKPWLMLT